MLLYTVTILHAQTIELSNKPKELYCRHCLLLSVSSRWWGMKVTEKWQYAHAPSYVCMTKVWGQNTSLGTTTPVPPVGTCLASIRPSACTQRRRRRKQHSRLRDANAVFIRLYTYPTKAVSTSWLSPQVWRKYDIDYRRNVRLLFALLTFL